MYTTGCEDPQQSQYVIETYTHFIYILCARNWILLKLYVCIVCLCYCASTFNSMQNWTVSMYIRTCSPLSANLQLVLACTGQYICYWALDSYIVSCLLFCHIDNIFITLWITHALLQLQWWVAWYYYYYYCCYYYYILLFGLLLHYFMCTCIIHIDVV